MAERRALRAHLTQGAAPAAPHADLRHGRRERLAAAAGACGPGAEAGFLAAFLNRSAAAVL
jgi:hypothetical protein